MFTIKSLSMEEQCKLNFLFYDYDNETVFTSELVNKLSDKYDLDKNLIASHIVMFIYPEYITFKF